MHRLFQASPDFEGCLAGKTDRAQQKSSKALEITGVPGNTIPFFETGGGMVILNASATIAGNVITGNRALCGIGIEIEGGSAVIQGNIITGNTQAVIRKSRITSAKMASSSQPDAHPSHSGSRS